MIEFKNVTKRYGEKTAVDDVSFNIEQGEFFVLIGPSGCGKTTTLKMINRLISLTNGYIYFNCKPISDYPIYEMRWDIGYVLQQIALFPHMTIKENIAQVPQMKKWSEQDIEQRVDTLLDMVGLTPEQFKYRKPDELSGGQRQRVGVIRALAADPPVILMDEPFSALDPISREKLQDDLIELQRKIKKTIVFVTHDIQEAIKLGDRICLLNDGRVEQIDTPENFMKHPKNDFVKQFLGQHIQTSPTIASILPYLSEAEVSSVTNTPTLKSTAKIEEAFQLLAQYDMITIIETESKKNYQLHRKDMFTYLNKQNKGGVLQ
ncbi:ABC transporter ATP-binding protein [Staphylococcus arlettae]|uniref:Carnitine transport ATP-binding protein OpuCA n=1 Tax=Staphylococcus arlettae TaxID=29378 RepID=A0A380CM69_9STAP|nr:ABC transporter ATP-binding protein [Staphylococcus arlettae]PNZ55011.1 glycine/betaine ABC transporter ATP-binding protein [Staphylococcus arlettae]GEP99646.1 glycine/betaine ABC transporter ATP-binding protein [Staphylococcus arlettae]SUJ23720.1 choline transport ATP-binding protein [Staphylococcus arlettae]